MWGALVKVWMCDCASVTVWRSIYKSCDTCNSSKLLVSHKQKACPNILVLWSYFFWYLATTHPHPLHACLLAKLDRKTDRESVGNLHKHDMLHPHISIGFESIQKYSKLFKRGLGLGEGSHEYWKLITNMTSVIRPLSGNEVFQNSFILFVEIILHKKNSFG